eukprot:c34283_g1_i1 orf=3-794(-)
MQELDGGMDQTLLPGDFELLDIGERSQFEDGCQYEEREEEFFYNAGRAFFQNRSLVAHQLNSFDQFMSSGIQRLFTETPDLEILPDYNPRGFRRQRIMKHARINFGDVTISKPDWTDENGEKNFLFPNEARIRNMTYNAAIHVDISMKVYLPGSAVHDRKGKSIGDFSGLKMEEGKQRGDVILQDMHFDKVFIGKIPVMVKSALCHLHDMKDEDSVHKGDCLFDVGGYFIIKGSEKVLIAQERPCNRVWCSSTKDRGGLYATFS